MRTCTFCTEFYWLKSGKTNQEQYTNNGRSGICQECLDSFLAETERENSDSMYAIYFAETITPGTEYKLFTIPRRTIGFPKPRTDIQSIGTFAHIGQGST